MLPIILNFLMLNLNSIIIYKQPDKKLKAKSTGDVCQDCKAFIGDLRDMIDSNTTEVIRNHTITWKKNLKNIYHFRALDLLIANLWDSESLCKIQ